MKLKLLRLFLWHLFFFLLFYDLRTMLDSQSLEALTSWFNFKGGMLNLSSLVVFFWYSAGTYLSLHFFYPNVRLKLVLGLVATVLIGIGGRYLIEEVFFSTAFGFDNYADSLSSLSYVLRNLFYVILHMSFGGVFFFIQHGQFKEKKEQALLLENKKTELAFLRSQVNPHFLFNTLNNIYSLVYQKSENALPALETLSAMLRYGLYEGEGSVSLEKEIESIKNYILLEEMRYDYPLKINLQIQGNPGTVSVPPLLFLPFVENAFKHGDLKAPIDILLDANPQQLRFELRNQVKAKQKDKVGGIGLGNIKKRLHLIYGDRHQLEIGQQEQSFTVNLMIQQPGLQ